MPSDSLNHAKGLLVSELKLLRDFLKLDFSDTSARPEAPIDSLIIEAESFSCPLLFKVFVAELFAVLKRQKTRPGLSNVTTMQIEKTIAVADRIVSELKVDLAMVFNFPELEHLQAETELQMP